MSDAALARVTVMREAMATEFDITIAGWPAREARQAAEAALAELAPLEQELSRYVENSDVSRINRLPAGGSTVVTPETFECLRIALEMRRRTGGAFDVTYASKGGGRGEDRLRLDESRVAVEVLADGIHVDLGGIGKGFALDHMAGILKDWGVESALLRASASTILAMDAPPGEAGWPMGFGPTGHRVEFPLVRRALGASGTAVKGEHVIDPSTGKAAGGRFRAWSLAPTGAEADALSTSFMILAPDAIRDLIRRHPEYRAWFETGPDAPVEPVG
ncbi:MAG: FAD:protein FMN transferase [Verrucomicrobiae bacterium]|nr:FAD:protein FMN transferase [Verrucomicrobiae bacterium]